MNDKLKDKFAAIVLERFHADCRNTNAHDTVSRLLEFLIERNYFSLQDMRRVVVVAEVPQWQLAQDINKSEAMRAIALEYAIAERTISNILKTKRDWIE
jgi:hypothetical protein